MTEQDYFILEPKIDSEETGRQYPAIESYENYDFKSKNSVHQIDRDEFPSFIPDIRFKLANGAKLCDLMSQATISANGLIVSDKLKLILESLNTIPFKVYPFKLEAEGIFYNYNWIHYVWNSNIDYVDFPNTEFNITEFGEIIEPVSIRSYSDLLEKQTKLGFIKMIYGNCISLKRLEFDLFTVPINGGLIISEKVKNLIEQSSLTGINIRINDRIKFKN